MKNNLEMDDISEGMYITVLRGEIEQKLIHGPDGPQVVSKEKDHYNGRVLEVTCVNMPYIIIKIHEPHGSIYSSRPDRLDLRKVKVMRISREYIHQYCPKLRIQPDFFLSEVRDDLEKVDYDLKEIFENHKH